MNGNPDWIKTARVLGSSAGSPQRPQVGSSGNSGQEYVDIDFTPALRRLLGEAPSAAVISDLKTVLKLLAGLKMDMLKAAIIHLAISETYRDILEAELGEEFAVLPGNRSKSPDFGEPT